MIEVSTCNLNHLKENEYLIFVLFYLLASREMKWRKWTLVDFQAGHVIIFSCYSLVVVFLKFG